METQSGHGVRGIAVQNHEGLNLRGTENKQQDFESRGGLQGTANG
jgi:hypothetical protein